MALEQILAPIRVGGVILPNRVARAAHGTGMARFGVSDDFIAYHVERARGGCGLSVIEAGTVHPSSHLDFAIHDDEALPGLARLADAVRPHGMKLFQQLWHGGNLYPAIDGRPPLAVSDRPGFTGVVGRPMSIAEIEDIIANGFVAAALRCREAGIDGVELHAAHGYLFHQFLSPASNTRQDRYGGDLAGRLRFLLETARAVRAAVGPDYPVGVRVGASQAPHTIDEPMAAEMVTALCGEGLVDFVSASWGDYYRMETMVGAMHNPLGYELPSATQLLPSADVPRMVTGRIRTLEEADSLIREGVADIVSLVRAQIAEPHLVAKTRAGQADRARPCIACNQGCVGGMARIGRLGCAVNPLVGLESRFAEPTQAEPTGRTVMIVGGGPAGLEAARTAALAGHRVILCEASSSLGGAVNVARRAPRFHTVGDIAWWLEQEVVRLGVDVRLNFLVEPDDVLAEKPDTVLIATGAQPRMDGFQPASPGEPATGVDLPHVLSSFDLLAGGRKPGATALVLDATGHLETLAVMDHLLAQNCAVTIVTPHAQLLPYVETTMRVVPALERSVEGALEVLTRHRLVAIEPGVCRVRALYGGAERSVPAETVVLVAPGEPMRGLHDALRDLHPDVHLIGDAAGPRDIQAAIADGHLAARAIVGARLLQPA